MHANFFSVSVVEFFLFTWKKKVYCFLYLFLSLIIIFRFSLLFFTTLAVVGFVYYLHRTFGSVVIVLFVLLWIIFCIGVIIVASEQKKNKIDIFLFLSQINLNYFVDKFFFLLISPKLYNGDYFSCFVFFFFCKGVWACIFSYKTQALNQDKKKRMFWILIFPWKELVF